MLHIKDLSEEFLRNIEDYRVPDMHLANHGKPLDEAFMKEMLMNAKERGPLIDLSKWEEGNSDES